MDKDYEGYLDSSFLGEAYEAELLRGERKIEQQLIALCTFVQEYRLEFPCQLPATFCPDSTTWSRTIQCPSNVSGVSGSRTFENHTDGCLQDLLIASNVNELSLISHWMMDQTLREAMFRTAFPNLVSVVEGTASGYSLQGWLLLALTLPNLKEV